MKRIIILFLCALCCAVSAQQSPQEEGRNRNRTPEEIAALKARRAQKEKKEQESVVSENDVSAAAEQENFDDIMGSFSDLAMRFSHEEDRDLDVFVYECKHISAEAFSRSLEPFLSVNGEIADCEDADLVIISDDKAHLEKLKAIAESIDRPVRQVLVSASVVEFQITDGFEKDLSIQYNQFANMDLIPTLPGGAVAAPAIGAGVADKTLSSAFATRMLDAILPSGGNPATLSGSSSYIYYDPDEQTIFSSFLTFLEQNGKAQILSSPSLVMRRGHTANILSGEDIPITESNVGSGGTSFSVEYKSVGIKLRVTPESIFENRVVLDVTPEVSNIIRYEESAAGRNPVIAIRNASTMLEMNDGYMVSIGGLLREEQIETKRRVPILGNIPLLGTLFRATNSESIRSQLVIFLTVKILDPDDLSADTIDTSTVPEELQKQVERSRAALPEKKSSIFTGIKRLFQ
jgi:type II secretory pathway component GspD/PulD (secretin)